MKRTKTRGWRSIYALALVVVIGLTASAGIAVSPLLMDFDMPLGESYTSVFSIQNTGDEAIKIRSLTAGFRVKDTGTPVFLFGAEGEEVYPYDGNGLLTIEPVEAILEAGEIYEFTYTIHLPEDLDPVGGRYVAALFESLPATDDDVTAPAGAGIVVATRVASLLLIRPIGEGTEEISVLPEIESFTARLANGDTSLLVSTLLANNGNAHIRPAEMSGTITIADPSGLTVAMLDVDPHNILPATDYDLKEVWNLPEDRVAGEYTIRVVINVVDPSGITHTVEESMTFSLP